LLLLLLLMLLLLLLMLLLLGGQYAQVDDSSSICKDIRPSPGPCLTQVQERHLLLDSCL
jgi:hypothetical protein